MVDQGRPVRVVGIVGLGRIGSQLERLCIDRGVEVIAIDTDPQEPEQIAFGRLAACDVVIESITEDLRAKHQIIASIQRVIGANVPVLSTTSAFTLDQLTATATDPAQVVRWHPFHPMSRLPLIEVATNAATPPEALDRAVAVALALGREPVVLADSPGLVVNRVLKAFTTAGLQAASDGADPDEIDQAAVDAGYPMGPVAIVDLVGPAVSLAVSRQFAAVYGPRFAPPSCLVDAVASGTSLREAAHAARDERSEAEPHHPDTRSLLDAAVTAELALLCATPDAPSRAVVERCLRSGAAWPADLIARLMPSSDHAE